MVQLAGGETAAQLKAMALEDDADAVNPVGADGTVVQLAPPLCVVALACAEGPDVPSPSAASTT